MTDHRYLHLWNCIPGIGSARLHALITHCGSAEAAWHAGAEDLSAAKLPQRLVDTIVQQRPTIDLSDEARKLQQHGIILLAGTDAAYPPLLAQIHSAPMVLYARGECDLQAPAVAIVGARAVTTYGRQACYRLAHDLAAAGITIVSGLALGIDAIAHTAALDAGRRTVAVLGSGVDTASIAPQSNAQLAQRIIDHGGMLLSQYPPGTQAHKGTFPARNRIMAGLSLGTLVIEAAAKSGSLITARHAYEENREVFAVPGSIFAPQSAGTHNLIAQGAQLVAKADDIIDTLQLDKRHTAAQVAKIAPSSPEEEAIIAYLSTHSDPIHIDDLLTHLEQPSTTLAATLTLMELKGLLKDVGGQRYMAL